jgi:hypothetical protein
MRVRRMDRKRRVGGKKRLKKKRKDLKKEVKKKEGWKDEVNERIRKGEE